MLTREEQNAAVQLDPELAEHLKQNPFPGVPWNDLEACRRGSEQGTKTLRALLKKVPEELEEYVKEIPMRDGYMSQIMVTKRTGKTGGPLIVLYHGGGFIMGNLISMIPTGRSLALAYGAVVVSVAYRFAPENPFPVGTQDALDGFLWCAANAAELGADPAADGFVVGGISAGGNLSAAVAQYAADHDVRPALTGLWQNVTCLMDKSILPDKYKDSWISRSQEGPDRAIILAGPDVDIALGHWHPDHKSPLFSPFNSPTAFKGIPTTFFQVCGDDPLRDDSYMFENELKLAGVKTKLIMYPGTPHAYSGFFPMLEISKTFRKDTTKGIGWLLGQEVSDEEIAKAQAASIDLGAL